MGYELEMQDRFREPVVLIGRLKNTWAKKGFNFIETSRGRPDTFVHVSGLDGNIDDFPAGCKVTFREGRARDGRTCAVAVRRIED